MTWQLVSSGGEHIAYTLHSDCAVTVQKYFQHHSSCMVIYYRENQKVLILSYFLKPS